MSTEDMLFSLFGLPVTVTGAGAILALLTALGFAYAWLRGCRRRDTHPFRAGNVMDAAGFGLLPGISVWKAFENSTFLGNGAAVFEPLGELFLFTAGGRFAVSRIELVLAAVAFAAVSFWMMMRKDPLPGNGDLLLTVLCAWGLFRAWTEFFRAYPLLQTGSVNLTQILFLAAADIPFAVWTAARNRTQKSTAFVTLEWIAVLSCETVMALNASGVLTAGSEIGDLAVSTGCAALCLLLVLLAGKDCRS